MITIFLFLALFTLVVAIPLLIYTFLVFPNVDGIAHNLSWYKYDHDSQHYIFWFGFWLIVVFSGIGAITKSNAK